MVGALVLTSTLSIGLLTLALVVEAVVVVEKVEMEEEEGKPSAVNVPMGNQ